MTIKNKILVVDDEPAVRESLKDWLQEEGYEVGLASSGEEAIEMVKNEFWHVVLLDLKMPGLDGIETLQTIKKLEPEIEVIIVTAYATIESAVESIKLGAYDYVIKPLDPEEVELQIKKIITHHEPATENIFLRQQLEREYELDQIAGQSEPMQRVFELITQVAPTDSTVLITGESGTGKELVARAIHANSPRCYGPFVAVSCGALPDTLLESKLFGYEKGAFTGATHSKKGAFEMANDGTLFLDEIGDVSPKTQVDLLRVLQQREFRRLGGHKLIQTDARIIAATNRDLVKAVSERKFREDLYYRLNVISIHLPPLRERKEDIPLLTRHFIKKFAINLHKNQKAVSPEAMKLLKEYDWPGNVRELENVIERAMVIGKGKKIEPEDLPITREPVIMKGKPKALSEVEKLHILSVLEENNWNISKCARKLQIDRQTLYNKIKKYGLPPPDRRKK
ncbi:MAG: sigma-54-dependent Fis family transcriptional regulator [Deltaproteobacteria bacterium]|nr:MAG: sigma-54-dependent Fis family transcriptional regulator [Deltaproteobacteria bacterium]